MIRKIKCMQEKRTLAIETVGKVGETVTVFGWVHARRNMGKLVFFDLRDMSGRLQVVGVRKSCGARFIAHRICC